MKDFFNNLHFVIYTNENSIHLSEIALKEFLLHSSPKTKISVISNDIPDLIYEENRKFFFNAKIPQMGGKQFSKVMMKFLKQIEEEYILFNCDDYFLYKKIDENVLNKILNLMIDNKVDYFSFDRKLYSHTSSFDIFKNDFFPDSLINVIPDSHFYRYSVQPCIWKKSSILYMLEKYGDICVHDLETNDIIRKTNMLSLGINWDKLGLMIPTDEIYNVHFCYSWVEIIRSGVFMTQENGFPLNPKGFESKFIKKLIDKYQIKQTDKYNKLLYKMK